MHSTWILFGSLLAFGSIRVRLTSISISMFEYTNFPSGWITKKGRPLHEFPDRLVDYEIGPSDGQPVHETWADPLYSVNEFDFCATV